MDFQNILHRCGDYNRYQLLLLISFGIINIFSAWHYFAQTIISFTPQHWCYHKVLSNLTFAEIEVFYSSFSHPSCTQISWANDSGKFMASNEKCKIWIYKYEYGYKSISAEMNWVCDDAHKLAIGQSLFFIGSVLGTILFGLLADRIGRLPTMIMSNLAGCLGDFLTSFTNSLTTFSIGRFISGLVTDTSFYLMYIMVFEYIRPSRRTFGLNIITGIFYCSGLVSVPWMAVYMGNWRSFLVLESIPIATVLLYAFFLCESAQWLITRNDYKGAVKSLKRVAKFNGRQVDDSIFDEFENDCESIKENNISEEKKQDTFLKMLITPYLRKMTVILLLKSMIITISFDIIGRNMEGLGTSPLILFSVTSFVYIPAGLSIILLQNKIGRKGMACGSLLMCGIFSLTTGFVVANLNSAENAVLLAVLVTIARYGTVVAYDAEAQYAAELIPTSVRGQGVANIHIVGYLFSFLSAYIIYLGSLYKPMPSIFVSIIMFLGAVLCLFLPETVNRKLPSSLAEGEEFGKNEKWFEFPTLAKHETK